VLHGARHGLINLPPSLGHSCAPPNPERWPARRKVARRGEFSWLFRFTSNNSPPRARFLLPVCIRHVFDNESPPQFVWHAGPGASRQGDGAWASSLFCMRLAPASLFCMRLACFLSWSKAGIGIEGRSKATRSEGDDLEESAARAFMRHGGRGRGGRG